MPRFYALPFLRTTALLIALALKLTLQTQAQALIQPPAWSGAVSLSPHPGNGRGYTFDADGNTYEVGSFSSNHTIGNTTLICQGYSDAFVAKYSPSGQMLWVRQLGTAFNEDGLDIAVDAAGKVYITGLFYGSISLGNGLTLVGAPYNFSSKVFVVCYSPEGTPEWAQQSLNTQSSSAGGGSIGLDTAGTVYVTGNFTRSITFGSYSIAAVDNIIGAATFLVRFDRATGTPLGVVKAFDRLSVDNAVSSTYPQMAVEPGGAVYLLISSLSQPLLFGGTTFASRGRDDIFVAHYSPQSAFEWVQQLGGAGDDTPSSGTTDAQGNLYLSGYFTGPAQFGTTTLPGAGSVDGFVLKYSPQGALQWLHSIGGAGSDSFSSPTLDAAGNVYVTGNFSGTAQLGTASITSAGNRDIIVASYSAQGQLRWVQQAGGSGDDRAYGIGIDRSGTLRVLGRYTGTCAFGTTSLTTAATTPELFMAQLSSSPLAIRSSAKTVSLLAFPNPANSQISLLGMPSGTPVQLLDALGRVARATTLTAAAQVSVRGLAPGLYTLRAIDAQGQQFAGKVVVE
ncbi:T9SS type A sorting domain-containing protein [Hymenobacter cellulosivorans]|uniref:T9SS type A sorting domain-containing protein n=1 Tax=Hymenobacter cellulosivorans TaxID=2932249 RepID=A0ABY4F6C8_9BACT|nr:T9SS type A sorting domain-containing protein [Hymenobacter cellulosivorans]UOQ52222.1 T9SS type A sorting domain-containing protein [Hymenobacter cellulosivorans]